jgi:hypothetical protein
MIDEQEFRQRLAALITTYDTMRDPREKLLAEWEWAWQELIYHASDDQSRRAYALLTLHIQNEYPEAGYRS